MGDGPRSQALDNLCESIGDERETMNTARGNEKGYITRALAIMQTKKLHIYKHAKVELSRVPGSEKLRVRVVKEEGDASVSDGDTEIGGDEPETDADNPDVGSEGEAGDEGEA